MHGPHREEGAPETAPAGVRWRPPTLPPAPPAGPPGGGGGSFRGGGGTPGSPELANALEPCLNDLAVVRTTFETLECYPRLRAELITLLDGARENLVRRLDELLHQVEAGLPPLTDEVLRPFQHRLLSLWSADEEIFAAWFFSHTAGGTPRSFRLFRKGDLNLFRRMAPCYFTSVVLATLKHAVQDEGSYEDLGAFDEAVYQDFFVLLFAALCAQLEPEA